MALTPTAGWAAFPYVLSYGGRLASGSGAPVAGPVELKLKFYDAATGGNQLGADVDEPNVTLSEGVFQAPIALDGPVFQAIFGSGASVFIEVTDVTHGQIYPRQSFSAVPYALRVPVDQATITYDNNGNLTLANPSPLSSNGAFTAPVGLDVLASDPTGLTAGDAGKLWYNGGIKYWNGASAQLLGVSGGGLQSIDGITENTQFLAVGIGGTSPSWIDQGSSHTLNLPLASAANATAGLLSNADYASFAGKLANGGQAGPVLVGTTDATALRLEADGVAVLTLTAAGNVGIGTTSPSSQLSIIANADSGASTSSGFNVTNINSSGYANMGLINSNGDQSQMVTTGSGFSNGLLTGRTMAVDTNAPGGIVFTNFASGGAPILFSHNASNVDLFINGSGNVGIGTTAPSATLDVAASSAASPALIARGAASQTANVQEWRSSSGAALASVSAAGIVAAPRVVVGSTAPTTTAALEINQGQILSKTYNNGGSTDIDWNNGNTQTASSPCTTFNFLNMLDGGSYSLIVLDGGGGTCSFSQATPDNLLSSAFSFVPANGATQSGKTTVFTFLRGGSVVYTTWVSGF